MGEIGGKMADLSIITADNSRYEKVEDIIADIRGSIEKTGGKFIEIPDRREAIRYSILHAQPGDMVAVIGKGHEDYQEINGVRHHFLDREVIEEAVRELREKEQGMREITAKQAARAAGGRVIFGDPEKKICTSAWIPEKWREGICLFLSSENG